MKKDLRLAALIRFASAITILNIFGHTLLGFETSYAHPVVALLTTYTLEVFFETLSARINKRKPAYSGGGFKKMIFFLLPAHITGLACSMLMFSSENLLPVIFASALAILSKVLFKVTIDGKVRHFLNPSNTGIAVSFLLFPWVSTAPPYQFTENVSGSWDWILPVIFIATGSFLNIKLTKKAPLIAAWLIGFFLQAVIRSFLFDNSMVSSLLPMTGVAFLLYTFYMISDPSTTPSTKRNQVYFGLAVAGVYGLLTTLHIVFGLFFSLIIVCTCRGLYFWISDMFQQSAKPAPEADFGKIILAEPAQQVFYEGAATAKSKVFQD
jgi:Na+-transporting NADH:ubiquinone oxidoreductase subunit NqrB